MKHHPDYELFEELGRGQATIVYRGHDLTLGRDVAIKELDEEAMGLNPNRKAQFLKEAQFLAQFEHENILRVYSVEKQHNWIIMEMMQTTLAAQILTKGLDPDLVRSVLRQTLCALDFLHRKQKVHAAIRPSNLLTNEEGFVKLSDFEETDSEGELRIPDCGKKYLAPELLRPEFGQFGPSLDFYNLGFTALELLFGPRFDSLFPGTGEGAINADMAWMRWHSSDDSLPPAKELGIDIPDDIATVIDCLIVKQVDQRPKSAKEILAMLEDRPLVRIEVATHEQPQPQRHSYVGAVREVGERAASLGNDKDPSPKKKSKVKNVKSDRRKLDKGKLIEIIKRPSVLVSLFTVLVVIVFFANAIPVGESPTAVVEKQPAPTEVTIEPAPEEHVLPPTKTELVTLVISPPTATVFVNGEPRELDDGFLELELPEDEDMQLEISHDEFHSVDQSITWQEWVDDVYLMSFDLELVFQGPELPLELTAMAGSAFDEETNLPLRAISNVLSNGQALEFVLVKPVVSALAGDSDDDFSMDSSAAVELGRPFYIAVTETSIAQYSEFYQFEGAESAGERWVIPAQRWIERFDKLESDSDLPVTNMSHIQAQKFCDWLGGRLPTENEWETAVRVLLSFDRHNVDPSDWRLFRGSELQPQSVGTGSRRNLELLNAMGNAAEWCVDNDSAQPVAKGCSFATPIGRHVQPTWRSQANPNGEWDIGIRVIIPVE